MRNLRSLLLVIVFALLPVPGELIRADVAKARGLAAGAATGGHAPGKRAAPGRIVSLNPSLTAIIVALGAGTLLVGVDDFSAKAQREVAHLPRVGGLYNPSLEAVVALEPDLVVLVPSVEQRAFREQLAAVRVRSLEFNPKRFDEVLETIAALGREIDREPAARARIAEVHRVRTAIERAVAGQTRRRAVLVLQRDPLYVVGAENFIDDMLWAAGAVNLSAALGEIYPRASLEWLIDAAPEVILDTSEDPMPTGEYWAQWPSLPAVREGRVVQLPAGLATLPGPFLDRALRALAVALHGEAKLEALERAALATSPEASQSVAP